MAGDLTSVAAGLRCQVVQLTEGVDFTAVGEAWSARMGLAPTGAALVRPDGHILAIAASDGADAIQSMAAALSAYLAPPMATALTGAA